MWSVLLPLPSASSFTGNSRHLRYCTVYDSTGILDWKQQQEQEQREEKQWEGVDGEREVKESWVTVAWGATVPRRGTESSAVLLNIFPLFDVIIAPVIITLVIGAIAEAPHYRQGGRRVSRGSRAEVGVGGGGLHGGVVSSPQTTHQEDL